MTLYQLEFGWIPGVFILNSYCWVELNSFLYCFSSTKTTKSTKSDRTTLSRSYIVRKMARCNQFLLLLKKKWIMNEEKKELIVVTSEHGESHTEMQSQEQDTSSNITCRDHSRLADFTSFQQRGGAITNFNCSLIFKLIFFIFFSFSFDS